MAVIQADARGVRSLMTMVEFDVATVTRLCTVRLLKRAFRTRTQYIYISNAGSRHASTAATDKKSAISDDTGTVMNSSKRCSAFVPHNRSYVCSGSMYGSNACR